MNKSQNTAKPDLNKSQDRTQTDEALKWKAVSTEHIVQDKWIDFRKVAYELPDLTRRGTTSVCASTDMASEK